MIQSADPRSLFYAKPLAWREVGLDGIARVVPLSTLKSLTDEGVTIVGFQGKFYGGETPPEYRDP